MTQFTLNDFYNRIDYLTEKGTLEELLAFLGVQCVEGSERDIFNLVDTDLLVFEVLQSDAKVRFEVFSPKGVEGGVVEDFFITLFDQHKELLSRLVDLLKEKYSHLGSLTFEEHYRDHYSPFVVKLGNGGYYITHNPDKFWGVLDANNYFNGLTPKNMLLRGRCNSSRVTGILGYALL